jgi:hypothetical protein
MVTGAEYANGGNGKGAALHKRLGAGLGRGDDDDDGDGADDACALQARWTCAAWRSERQRQ